VAEHERHEYYERRIVREEEEPRVIPAPKIRVLWSGAISPAGERVGDGRDDGKPWGARHPWKPKGRR
jgi:hypothetical protein